MEASHVTIGLERAEPVIEEFGRGHFTAPGSAVERIDGRLKASPTQRDQRQQGHCLSSGASPGRRMQWVANEESVGTYLTSGKRPAR